MVPNLLGSRWIIFTALFSLAIIQVLGQPFVQLDGSGSPGNEGDVFRHVPLFEFEPNAVAYPGKAAEVVVKLVSGQQITAPSTLKYRFVHEDSAAGDLFTPVAATAGFLQFTPAESTQKTIKVPIDWDRVPASVQHRMKLQLQGFMNAAVAEQGDAIGLHVFGVAPGVCPPGTALKEKAAESKTPSMQWWKEGNATTNIFAGVLSVVADGTPVPLASRVELDAQRLDVGAIVSADITSVTLCVLGDAANLQSTIDPAVTAGDTVELLKEVGSSCRAAVDSSPLDEFTAAWRLQLQPGQNEFNISGIPLEAAKYVEGEVDLYSFTLSVVRLAEEGHAALELLEVKGIDGTSTIACGTMALALQHGTALKLVNDTEDLHSGMNTKSAPQSSVSGQAQSALAKESAVRMTTISALKECSPGVPLSVTVPSSTDIVSIAPQLLHPEIPNIRVEVNGQVLSRGGDVSADQISDTSLQSSTQTKRNVSTTFLPSAYVLGMAPGIPVDIAVVVVAEDGATSARYPLTVTREIQGGNDTELNQGEVHEGVLEYAADAQGWPPSPATLGNCTICPAGWSSSVNDAPACTMCSPGSAAMDASSTECAPCTPGTFSLSWGSSHCKHCIAGTYTDAMTSTVCRMCPSGTSTIEDGQSACNITLAPATNLERRYAVVVYFSVFLTGIDLDTVVLKAGVNAPAESILGSLLRTDTAAAFNISAEDVRVMSVHHVARRTLQANVSATLGVDLPEDATEEDIAAALAVEKLSADGPIELLSQDPDAFFGRTTRTLDVGVRPSDAETVENRPSNGPAVNRWALVVPGILGLITGAAIVIGALLRSKQNHGPAVQRALAWARTLRVMPASQRYSRHS